MLRPLRSTPARLRFVAVLTVTASIAFAFLGWRALLSKAEAIDRAQAENGVHSRLQTVRTGLVGVDAAAGVDVLLGPRQTLMTPDDVRWGMVPVAVGLVVAARAQEDLTPLAAANLRLTEYTARVGTARELSRLDRPEAPQTLAGASRLLHSEVLPRLSTAQEASARRLQDDVDASTDGTAVEIAIGAATAILLLGAQVWLARRTRRLVNAGLAGGLGLVVALSVTAVMVGARSDGRADEVRAGSYVVAQHLVDARMAAFEARSVEAVGVLTGRVGASEAPWRDAMTRAADTLDRAAALAPPGEGGDDVRNAVKDALGHLDTYAAVHARLVAADRAGQPATVREIAVSPTVEGSPGAFEDVDATTAALLARQSRAAETGWAEARAWLVPVAWGCLLAGGLAAALGAGGLAPRLREYR